MSETIRDHYRFFSCVSACRPPPALSPRGQLPHVPADRCALPWRLLARLWDKRPPYLFGFGGARVMQGRLRWTAPPAVATASVLGQLPSGEAGSHYAWSDEAYFVAGSKRPGARTAKSSGGVARKYGLDVCVWGVFFHFSTVWKWIVSRRSVVGFRSRKPPHCFCRGVRPRPVHCQPVRHCKILGYCPPGQLN